MQCPTTPNQPPDQTPKRRQPLGQGRLLSHRERLDVAPASSGHHRPVHDDRHDLIRVKSHEPSPSQLLQHTAHRCRFIDPPHSSLEPRKETQHRPLLATQVAKFRRIAHMVLSDHSQKPETRTSPPTPLSTVVRLAPARPRTSQTVSPSDRTGSDNAPSRN